MNVFLIQILAMIVVAAAVGTLCGILLPTPFNFVLAPVAGCFCGLVIAEFVGSYHDK